MMHKRTVHSIVIKSEPSSGQTVVRLNFEIITSTSSLAERFSYTI